MNDMRPVLIVLRFAMGAFFIYVATLIAASFPDAKGDQKVFGLFVGFTAAFAAGFYFVSGALDASLWTPQWPPPRERNEASRAADDSFTRDEP
jgi:MFS family permease